MDVKKTKDLFFWMMQEGYQIVPHPISHSDKEGYKIMQRVGNEHKRVAIYEMIRRYRESKIKGA